MTTPDDARETIPLAAELALGVLDGDERAEALRRVLADPDFARDVDAWRMRLAALFAAWPEAPVGEDIGDRVFTALDGAPPVAATAPVERNRWAWAAGAATLVAASLVLALALRPERIVTLPAPPVAHPSPLIAVISPANAGKPFAALYDADRGEIRLAGSLAVPTGKSAELWSIGADQVPRALGLLDRPSDARVTVGGAKLARIVPGATLAVSIEPEGGSPTGAPTGPVVATGVLSRA